MVAELPAEYLDGIAGIEVSPKVIPHPVRADIYTLGECIPLPSQGADRDEIQSRVVLYHGSFQASAHEDPEFDWREEAWETLTHEVRHHLEWRARVPDLEALDHAAEANYARQDGDRFDPLFYHDGELIAPGVFKVEDDYFLEQVVRRRPASVRFEWHGKPYRFEVADEVTLPALLIVEGVEHPPPGDLVLVLARKAGLRDLFGGSSVYQAVVEATKVG
jgi:Zincin-like metallopeptidase